MAQALIAEETEINSILDADIDADPTDLEEIEVTDDVDAWINEMLSEVRLNDY